ncbi:MAG: SRPBCC domain-containing protein [Gammaproteobacteria bacterium]|nr:SRPBCC domain-containing protein [Gammaproteobacteria bacterium]
MKIIIETQVNASLDAVWSAWTTPEDIIGWNFASDDWACPSAELDLKKDGNFCYRMEAKDGSMGFDFNGTFIHINPKRAIHYKIEDGRLVTVEFIEQDKSVKVIEEFEAEDENSAEMQKQGWQSILNNFKKHVENKVR